MPKKTVTTKEQIPKWYTKRIKGFSDLTQQEALFEYEALKVRERARKYAKRQNIVYIPPKIVRPSTVTEPDVNFIRRIELPTIQEAVKKQAPIVSAESGLYDYEHEYWKEENLPDYQVPHYEDYHSSWEDYEGDEEYFEDDDKGWREYVDSIQVLPDIPEPSTPEPTITPTVEKEITEEDIAWVDPNTAEVYTFDDIADLKESAIDFLQSLKDNLKEEADAVVLRHSYYDNGRTKAQSQIRFYNNNADRAYRKVCDKIDSILNDPNRLEKFAKNNAGPHNDFERIQMAASEYIASSYKRASADSDAQLAYLFSLLDDGPMSVGDAMELEESDYYDEE